LATPKFDDMCIDFVKRIPDQFRSTFAAGSGVLPNANLMKAEAVVDYINRGMQDLFNQFWQSAGGDTKKFIKIFPELIGVSQAVDLASGNYTVASPYKDFYKLIGAVTSANKFIKVKDESLYTVYLSSEYDELVCTVDKPAIIQVNQLLACFPQSLTGKIKFHYIKVPISPTTGAFLAQNGTEDSPFFEHWHKAIVDSAYLRYLEETNQTT